MSNQPSNFPERNPVRVAVNALEQRVLSVAPTARDAEITRRLLSKSGLVVESFRTLRELTEAIAHGAAALLLTEDALSSPDAAALVSWLESQPEWSDLPVVLLMRPGDHSSDVYRAIAAFRNITLLERPAPMRSLVSAVQAAVRARLRQYQIRDQIGETRAAEERFRQLSNLIPQLAWIARPDGYIYWYNQRWYDYTGMSHQQVEGWRWQSVLDPAELPRVIEHWQKAFATQDSWEDTFPIRRFDGEYRWHLSRANAVRDATGQIIMWIGTNTDVTEQRETAAKLAQAAEDKEHLLGSERAARSTADRANRLKDEFLATLSHELRTPLNAIVGWVHLLKQSGNNQDLVDEAVKVIDRNVRLQTRLIEDLLDVSRIISGKVRLEVTRVDLSEVVAASVASVKPAADAKGIRLNYSCDPRCAINGDSSRLQQIFWNLLTNAIKFTPADGTVSITATCTDTQVTVTVTDTGEGIDPNFLPRIFERFSQEDSSPKRKHGGLGLGLSIVKSLVEMHGGTITVASEGESRGSSFTLRFPFRASATSPLGTTGLRPSIAFPTPRNDVPQLPGIKILVVDDERDARELVKRFLQRTEAVVTLAGSVNEAELLIDSFHPDMIISDIGMPERDGYDLMQSTRKKGINTPAIALTAFARAEDRLRAIQAGYQAHLSKPIDPKDLLTLISTLVGPQAARSPEKATG